MKIFYLEIEHGLVNNMLGYNTCENIFYYLDMICYDYMIIYLA